MELVTEAVWWKIEEQAAENAAPIFGKWSLMLPKGTGEYETILTFE